MRLFIAGIMQGSLPTLDIHCQNYRTDIHEAIRSRYPEAQIIDPRLLHPESPSYDDERGRHTMLQMMKEAGECDLLIAYLPEASMGTALEMWQAYERKVPILTITPMVDNWVVKFLSAKIFSDLNEFAEFVAAGGLEELRGAST
jgi:hypothetical protein